jgi:hypothetical protein
LALVQLLFQESLTAKCGLMSKPTAAPKFQQGDRVAERPKNHGIYSINQATKDRIAQYRTQRYGTVLEIKTKKTSRSFQRVLVIQWDHLTSPCEHAQHRICSIEEFPKIMENACESIAP